MTIRKANISMTTFQGKVISVKNDKTAIVVVRRRARHPLYGKAVAKTKHYAAHDLLGVQVGDEVEFVPCKPVSKTKRWKIVRVVGGETIEGKNSDGKQSSNGAGKEIEKQKNDKTTKRKAKPVSKKSK